MGWNMVASMRFWCVQQPFSTEYRAAPEGIRLTAPCMRIPCLRCKRGMANVDGVMEVGELFLVEEQKLYVRVTIHQILNVDLHEVRRLS